MLERMKVKVEEDESLAQAYDEMAKRTTSIDQEIDKAIGTDSGKVNRELSELKKELGIE
jgi:phage shock protein A